jgi:hypothetical protein
MKISNPGAMSHLQTQDLYKSIDLCACSDKLLKFGQIRFRKFMLAVKFKLTDTIVNQHVPKTYKLNARKIIRL